MSARLRICATLALGSLAFVSTGALAEETRCTGRIGAVALDNIQVPDGATCFLNGTRANGTLKVGRGASLFATSISINGNIQGEGANNVSVGGASFVGGSVQVVQGRAANVSGASINGDLLYDLQTGPVVARSNMIGGNLQAFANAGGVSVIGNLIKGNLQCKENVPPPTGGGNRASSKEDQCEGL